MLFWNKNEKTFSCTVEDLITHLGSPYECENFQSQDDNTEFDSEDTEKNILWDFLHEKGDITRNIKFWFQKSTDNSIIERYCVSSEYSRLEKETAICITSEFQQEFVKKLDIKILYHRTMKDESIHPFVSDILNIPTEILSSGDDAVHNYLTQLSKGKVKVYHARGMIVGCAGAGKTTLLKKLKELPLIDILNTKSTRGVDIQTDVFTVSGKEISVTSENVLTHFNIKKSTTTMMETMSDKQDIEVRSLEHNTNLTESGLINEQEYVPIIGTDDSNNQSFLKNKSNERVAKKLLGKESLKGEEKQPSGSSEENLAEEDEKQPLEPIQVLSFLSAIKDEIPQTITMFDFAGQLAYYVTHQMYLSPRRSFYMMVIDMTKTLDGRVTEEAGFNGLTYKEIILHWMEMIDALHESVPVILVATHAEGKSKEDIRSFFVHLWKLIPEDIQKRHVSHKREFFVELEKSSGIAEIKESILNIVTTAKHWGEFRPTMWVMFENYLMKSKERKKVMKMQDLWAENKKLDSEYQLEKKEDMMKMLQFFHDTGTILYFDEDVLRDDIILDVPWFVDAFKHIITDPIHANEDLEKIRDTFVSKNLKCQNALDDLQQSGMLPVSLVEAVWKFYENKKIGQKFANHKYVQNMQGIMRYMERLGMIAEITTSPEQMWYVPCMNKRLFSTDDFKDFPVSSTVCFKFKFLPQSIYYRLIASCINFLRYKILDWPQPEYFHKNAVLVHKESFDHKYYFLIGSVEIQNIIEIQVLLQKGFEVNRKDSSNFKNEITDQLEKLRKTFHTNLEKFEIGYRCRQTIFSEQTAAHFIPEFRFKETIIKCPQCRPPNRIVCEDVLYPWNKEGETDEDKTSEQARKANDNSNRDVGGNVASQGVRFTLETSLRVPGVSECNHISCVSSESAWVSDYGILRQVDKHGSVIKTVSGRQTHPYAGSHTVTRDGDLLFIDSNDRHVYRVAGEEQILTLQTDQCELFCIFSSPRNGDLLIGGWYRDDRDEERGVILRYNEAGVTCIQKIERDRVGRHLYTAPAYITENMNGDVIVSDVDNKLVVVDKSGRHRFTYTGHPSGSRFSPSGICTDTSGRILVCDYYSNSVHILTRDGEVLSRLQTQDHDIVTPWSICMDNEQRVWVGDYISNRVCIYRYPPPQ